MRGLIHFLIYAYQIIALIIVICNPNITIDFIIIATQLIVLGFQEFILPKINFKDER